MLALVSACLVRFVFLPGACLFGLLFLRALNSPWFPSDRSAALVLLTMSCMPAAQNLVLLTQLRDATRPLATSFSGIDVAPIRLCHHSRHILAHRLHVGSRVTFFTSHPTQCISNVYLVRHYNRLVYIIFL